MRLTALPLINYLDNNHYQIASNWTIRQEANTLYFQVVDLDQAKLRYMSEASVITLTLTFPSFDDSLVITATAQIVQPLKDKSIFKVDLTDLQIPRSGTVKFQLVEDSISRKWNVMDMLIVEPSNDGGC